MKSLAPSYVWWLGMDKDNKNIAKTCKSRKLNNHSLLFATMHPLAWQMKPWQRLQSTILLSVLRVCLCWDLENGTRRDPFADLDSSLRVFTKLSHELIQRVVKERKTLELSYTGNLLTVVEGDYTSFTLVKFNPPTINPLVVHNMKNRFQTRQSFVRRKSGCKLCSEWCWFTRW